jgi:predicted transcriptional regulator
MQFARVPAASWPVPKEPDMSDLPNLSRRERQIMEIIYARGKATASSVLADLPDPPSRTAVRTLLTILEQKGHLTHLKEGREFLYQPTRPRSRAGKSALRRVIETFFDGSLEKAVAAHLAEGQRSGRIDPQELQRLAELIEEARRKGI